MSINPNCKSMLLLTVNNSIGNPSLHLDTTDLIKLFDKNSKGYTNIDKYAIDTIQMESTKYEFNDFIKDYNIPNNKASYLLSYNP